MSPENDGTNNATGVVLTASHLSATSSKSSGALGRAASSNNYSSFEHEAILDIISSVDGAYESSVGSSTWQTI